MAAALGVMALAATRSADTVKHVLRVQQYLRVLGRRLQALPTFAQTLADDQLERVVQAAVFHDMGTIGIPDRILLKPGRVTPEEFEIIKTHTTLARDVLDQAAIMLGVTPQSLALVRELTYCHHERWDGSGYPRGIKGEEIPTPARLLAITDVYDALISDRVYKSGVPHDQAVAVIFQGRGSQFDPDMVDAFIEIQDEFRRIAEEHADTESDMQGIIAYMANAIAEDAVVTAP